MHQRLLYWTTLSIWTWKTKRILFETLSSYQLSFKANIAPLRYSKWCAQYSWVIICDKWIAWTNQINVTFRFGVDTAAYSYLCETLEQMSGDMARLVPLYNLFPAQHVYCAISRVLFGRELLWFTLWRLCAKFLVQSRDELLCFLTKEEMRSVEAELNDYERYIADC